MHSKNNNKTKTFIQGLRPFSSSIPKTLKKHLRKGGYNYSNIVDNWTKIVSKKISDACYPITIKMGKGMIGGRLVLNVVHGKEVEVEYEKNEIIDKINSFFGDFLLTRHGRFLLLLSYQARIFFDKVSSKCIIKIIINHKPSFKGLGHFRALYLKL